MYAMHGRISGSGRRHQRRPTLATTALVKEGNIMAARYPISFRFWRHVDKTNGCWLWTASLDGKGYGQFGIEKRSHRAHRVAWELTFGAVPAGLCVLHHCDNPRCVNPAHLFLGSMKDNTRDMLSKQRDGHGRMPGARNPNAKLTDDDVRTIRRRREEGQKLREIAADYGITEANVSYIFKRKGWKHVI